MDFQLFDNGGDYSILIKIPIRGNVEVTRRVASYAVKDGIGMHVGYDVCCALCIFIKSWWSVFSGSIHTGKLSAFHNVDRVYFNSEDVKARDIGAGFLDVVESLARKTDD